MRCELGCFWKSTLNQPLKLLARRAQILEGNQWQLRVSFAVSLFAVRVHNGISGEEQLSGKYVCQRLQKLKVP